MLKARERLTGEGRWEACRGESLANMQRRNEATDGSLLMYAPSAAGTVHTAPGDSRRALGRCRPPAA